jgi:hypothetical protein
MFLKRSYLPRKRAERGGHSHIFISSNITQQNTVGMKQRRLSGKEKASKSDQKRGSCKRKRRHENDLGC